MAEDYTRQIASFAVHSKPSDVPGPIRHEATRALVNWMGLPINECRSDAVNRVIAAFGEFSGPRQATLLGRGDKIDIFQAALINSFSSSVDAYDDTHLSTIIHPTCVIAPVILALSEIRKVTGNEFIHALILGIEIQCRLARALLVPPAECDEAWFLTGLTGGVGAAAAAGRLLGLNEQQMVWAISLGAARAAGTRETHRTMAMPLIPSWAAEGGVRAAFLARQDFKAPDTQMEGARGLGRVYARKTNFPVLLDRLGEYWELTQNAYKPFPAGIVMHGAITAALEVAVESHPEPEEIRSVEIVVHPLCLKLTGWRLPRKVEDTAHSVYHWVAIALIDRRIGINQLTEAYIVDPAVAALRDRVEASVNESFKRDEAHISVTLTDGRIVERHVDHALGSIERPMSDQELTAKLHDLSDHVIGVHATGLLAERCWGVERMPDTSAIVRAACGGL
ncbi:MAG: MmgE/PrpD family protein [Chloroflexota bacterium]